MLIDSTTTVATKMFLAFNVVSIPSVSNIPLMLEQAPRPIQKTTSLAPAELKINSTTTVATLVDSRFYFEDVARPTTDLEKVIGELREWAFLKDNWDGEGAYSPSSDSIKQAVEFVRLISNNATLPEPTLLASGNVSLYWNNKTLYADIEFLGDQRIAYFIKNNEDKHKGILSFNAKKMPAVFSALVGI